MSRFRYIVFRNGLVIRDEDNLPNKGEVRQGDILFYRDGKYQTPQENKWHLCFSGEFGMNFDPYSDVSDQLKLAVILLGETP